METTNVDIGPSVLDKVGGGDIPDSEIQPRLVIAIDFGTYACGIALQWRSGYEENCLESIKVPSRWAGMGFCTRKTPSCLLLKPDRSLAEFGYKADLLFSKNESIPKKKRPQDWNDWYYFRFFKMRLYCGKDLSTDTQMEAENGRNLPIVEVLSKTLAYLKDEAISMLKEDGVVYPEEETKWVITVPAIWNDPAKHVMHEAAEQAGIPSKNLSMALEPECAAIYCSKLPLDKIEIADNTDEIDNTNDKKKTRTVAAPGQIITVVDMGGGTVDITTVEINQDRTMRQVSKACGGPLGGTKVNEKFEMYLQNLIGAETMRTFVKKHAIDYHDLRMDFEGRKREMKDDDDEQIPIKLPDKLKQLWEAAEDKDVDDILESKDISGVEFEAGRLFFGADIIQQFFQETVDGILKILKENVFTDPNLNGAPVSSILLVGGFAESSFVVERLRKGLKNRQIPVIRPQNPELAVLNGAVLFGQNEMIVSSRIMRHTYGVAMAMEFVEGKHRKDEQFQIDRTLMANNVFRKHVTIGQSVKIGDWVSSKEYYPDSEHQTSTMVYIFTSDKQDPVHTTDPGSVYIGRVQVDFGNRFHAKKKAVKVEFKFGGTELKVRAVTSTGSNTHVKYLKIT